MLKDTISNINKGKPASNSEFYSESDEHKNVILRLEIENLRLINDSLKEKVIELSQKLKVCEEIFRKFDTQYSALFEGKPIAGAIVINKEYFDALVKFKEECNKIECEKMYNDTELSLALVKKEKEVEELNERVKELREMLKRQEDTYKALIEGNENVVRDMHNHFNTYNEVASKELMQLKQVLDDKKLTVDSKVDELRQTILNLEAQKEILEGKIKELKAELNEANMRLENSEVMYNSLQEKYENLKNEEQYINTDEKEDLKNKEKENINEENAILLKEIESLKNDVKIKIEENLILEDKLKIQIEITNDLKSELNKQNTEFTKNEANLRDKIDNLEISLKYISDSNIDKSGIENPSIDQSNDRLMLEKARMELIQLKSTNDNLLTENSRLQEDLAREKSNSEKFKDDSQKFQEELLQFEDSKKENIELLEELTKLYNENVESMNSGTETSKELMISQIDLREAKLKLKSAMEKLPVLDLKDLVNLSMKKLCELVKRAKVIYASHRTVIESLKKENDFLKKELELGGIENMLARKKKKLG